MTNINSASRTMGFDDWMDHKGSAGSGDFLKNWKEDGQIDIVVHPTTDPAVVWSHTWYGTYEDRDTKELKLRYTRFNSMETEKVLTRQRFRKPDGTREFPPVLCPFSLLLEWVRNEVEEGRISWVDPIFDIDAGEGVIIHAGGFCNLFGRDDLSNDELAELRKAGIRRDEAYTENGAARMQYLLPVIPYDEPSLGCVIARESQTVGDKMKQVIRDRREDLGKEAGDPRINPVVFRWTYNEKEAFAKKYQVKVITSLPVDPAKLPNDATAQQVEKLEQLQAAMAAPGPSLTKLTEPSNLVVLRRSFEQFWVHKVVPPWELLFAKAMAFAKGTPAAQAPEDFEPDQLDEGGTEGDGASESAATPTGSTDDMVACDKCGAAMKETADKCGGCGAEYVMDDAKGYMVLKPEPAPEPTKPRSRSEAAAARPPKRQAGRSKS